MHSPLEQIRVSAEDVELALRSRGGTATRREITRSLDVPVWSVARRLADLIDRGRVQRSGHGVYRLRGESPGSGLQATAAEVVQAISDSGAEAHLTGFDLVAAHSHQFIRSFPHLVYADPDALEQVAFALAQASLQPVLAGPAARNVIAHAPDPDRTVVLRGQPVSRMDRLGVRSEIAPPEKAWLDLLREARTGNLPISLAEVGAILASMLRASADERQLLRWAREMGYERQVRAVLDPASAAAAVDAETRELAEGALR